MLGDGKKILIIEDNDMNMKLFNDLLEAHGFTIISASDGLNVNNLIRQHKPDIVLMDIQLPEISGVDVIRKIKADKEIADVPVIAVTAYAIKDNQDEVMGAGCDAYVSKPISIEPFLQTIETFLNKKAS